MFELSDEFLIDTGCGVDMIQKELIKHLQHGFHKVTPMSFNTAGGETPIKEDALGARCAPFGNDLCEFYCMEDSPTVASVGAKCKRGFHFIWLADKARSHDVLVGHFNMSLWLVVLKLRSRGGAIDLAAWFPWRSPDDKPCFDSCGIFR